MATIIPFRGVLYDPAHVPDISQVVAPPYDIISPDGQRALHDRHPYNVIQLELGMDRPGDNETQNRYTRAADRLRDWQRRGVLRRDNVPAVYLYRVDYQAAVAGAMVSRRLRGLLTTVKLEEFGSGEIFPHENTRSSAKLDRLRLLERCRANFSPIFSLFSDPDSAVLQLMEKSIDVGRPRIEFHDEDGFRQRLWAVTDQAVLRDLIAAVQSKPLFIADGHHRYETALAYRRARQQLRDPVANAPDDNVLMLVSSLEDPGLTLLPTHRVVRTALPPVDEVKRRLRDTFSLEDIAFAGRSEDAAWSALLKGLHDRGASEQVFGLAIANAPGYLLLTLKPQYRDRPGTSARDRLDVSVLHQFILDPLGQSASDEQTMFYTKDEQEALQLVHRGEAQAAFLLNPPKISEVRAVAAAGDRMPHKSTYFFPKPLTGLIMNVFDEP